MHCTDSLGVWQALRQAEESPDGESGRLAESRMELEVQGRDERAADGQGKEGRDELLKKKGTWVNLFPCGDYIDQRYFSVYP